LDFVAIEHREDADRGIHDGFTSTMILVCRKYRYFGEGRGSYRSRIRERNFAVLLLNVRRWRWNSGCVKEPTLEMEIKLFS
jgi:hypothetical protein